MIEPKYYTLNNLFSERVFRVPYYQRFYSWGRKQREDLFGDIKDLSHKGGNRHHFMATIVCYRTKEVKPIGSLDYTVYDIVDGQQRITTLVLLLKAIEMRLDEGNDRNDVRRLLVKDDDNLLLLQTNNINQDIFNRYVRYGLLPEDEEIRRHADRNLAQAMEHIARFLDEWTCDGGTLLELLRLLRNRIGFVVYDTEDESAVYTVFESLNSRGLEVDELDKCKTMLMGIAFEKSKNAEAAAANIQELQDLWAKIYGEVATYPIRGEEILRVTATIRLDKQGGKPLRALDSLEGLRVYCTKPQQAVDVTRWLLETASKLMALHKNVFWGPATKILHARILAVALMLTDSLSKAEREKALEQWQRVTFRIFGLCRRDSRTKVGDYVRLARRVIQKKEGARNFGEVMEALRGLGCDYPVESAIEELEGQSCYEGFESECRYILWRYEEHLAAEQGAGVSNELRERIWSSRSASETIEHIFPQSPGGTAYWSEQADSTKALQDYVHRIGNLLLLPPGLNSEAGCKPFEQKKKIYQRAEGLRMVKEVLDRPDWNLKEIGRREKKILAWAKEAWADLPR